MGAASTLAKTDRYIRVIDYFFHQKFYFTLMPRLKCFFEAKNRFAKIYSTRVLE